MKHGNKDEEAVASKRRRTKSPESRDLFDSSFRKQVTDLLDAQVDGSGYIEGRIFMLWPSINDLCRFQFELKSDSQIYRFHVELAGKCSQFVKDLGLKLKDHICLALRGVKIESRKKSSAPHYVPIALTYRDGIIVKFCSGPRDGEIFNTWELDNKEIEDDWFISPVVPDYMPRIADTLASRSLSAGMVNSKKAETHDNLQSAGEKDYLANISGEPINHLNVALPGAASKSNGNILVGEGSEVPHPNDDCTIRGRDVSGKCDNKPTGNKSRKDKREQFLKKQMIRQKQKASKKVLKRATETDIGQTSTLNRNIRQEASHLPHMPPDLGAPTAVATTQKTLAEPASDKSSKSTVPPPSGGQGLPASLDTSLPTPPASQSVFLDTSSTATSAAPLLRAGFHSRGTEYIALAKVESKKAGAFLYVVGVVTSSRDISRTVSNDWSQSLTIVDPSMVNGETGIFEGVGVMVNMFSKKHESWLPRPKYGDIIILRKLKRTSYGGKDAATAYPDQLCWALYDSDTRQLHHGSMSDTPSSDSIGDRGILSPFWRPEGSDAPEFAYCALLADWWKALQSMVAGKVVTISPEMTRRPIRQYRLIMDASPSAPPDGFFDCTVEILHGFQNDFPVYSLYVTDYTTNAEIIPIQASWCPPELADHVLKVEMWDAAADVGPTMRVGEYWSLRNLKMTVTSGGYVQAKIQEAHKIQKLDESPETCGPHLRALLKRKEQWKKKHGSAGVMSNKWNEELLQDVEADTIINCTVEIVHIDRSSPTESMFYVTDYTYNPRLPSFHPERWARGLDKYIVRIILSNGQESRTKHIEQGNFFFIKKLRLSKSAAIGGLQGRLGGAEMLIHPINDISDENVKALKSRKQRWLRERDRLGESSGVHEDISQSSILPRTLSQEDTERYGVKAVKEIMGSGPVCGLFRLVGRVVDFWPLKLEDSVVLRCSMCSTDIPAKLRCCTKCYHLDDVAVQYFYRLAFRLQDAAGDEICVSLSDQCLPLKPLPPVDLRDDPEALNTLKERLLPLIGNLPDVHEGILIGRSVTASTPTLVFTIDAWPKDATSERTYALFTYAPLPA